MKPLILLWKATWLWIAAFPTMAIPSACRSLLNFSPLLQGPQILEESGPVQGMEDMVGARAVAQGEEEDHHEVDATAQGMCRRRQGGYGSLC
jgi:hypothetical protein